MKHNFIISVAILACFCLTGCADFNPFNTKKNLLIIKPASATRADNSVVREDGSRVYNIGSLFLGGVFPSAGKRTGIFLFYEGEFSSWYEAHDSNINPLAFIETIQYANNEYSNSGDAITEIWIPGIDEGSELIIRMNQGNLESAVKLVRSDEVDTSRTDATELIKSVNVKSFTLPYSTTDDVDINIVITLKTGATITLLYSGKFGELPIT